MGLLYWLALAFLLSHFGIPVQNTALLVARGMEQSGAFNTSFYVSCLLVVLLFALLCDTESTERSSRRLPLARWRASAAVGCALLGLSLIVRISLRPAAADAALALGNALEKLEQHALAEEAYRLATQLGPEVESYQAMLAKAYAEHARRRSNATPPPAVMSERMKLCARPSRAVTSTRRTPRIWPVSARTGRSRRQDGDARCCNRPWLIFTRAHCGSIRSIRGCGAAGRSRSSRSFTTLRAPSKAPGTR